MTRNKKKKADKQRKQRQQKKQQRRHQRTRNRSQTTPTFDNSVSDLRFNDLPMSLSPQLGVDFGSDDMVALLEVAADTEDLLDESEFDDIELDPFTAVTSFVDAAEEMGLKPDEIVNEEQMQEALVEAVRQLLTPTLRQEIVQAASALSDRASAAGDQRLLKKAAAVQTLVQEEKFAIALPFVGLIRQLVTDGIEAGFALIDISKNIEEAEIGEDQLAAYREDAELTTQVENTLNEAPALRRYLEKQIDTTFEEGRSAIFNEELVLNLYSDAELREVAQQVQALWAEADVDIEDTEAIDSESTTDEKQNALLSAVAQIMDSYLEQIFTQERLAEAQHQLKTLLTSSQYRESKWIPFLQMQHAALGSDDALDTERDFLVMALWAEIKPYLVNPESRNSNTETDDTDDTVAVEQSA